MTIYAGVIRSMAGERRSTDRCGTGGHVVVDFMEIGESQLTHVFLASSLRDRLVVGEDVTVSGIEIRQQFVLIALQRANGEIVRAAMPELTSLCDSWLRAVVGSAGFATIPAVWAGFIFGYRIGWLTFVFALACLFYLEALEPRRRFLAAARALG